jgi:hypothetical protein
MPYFRFGVVTVFGKSKAGLPNSLPIFTPEFPLAKTPSQPFPLISFPNTKTSDTMFTPTPFLSLFLMVFTAMLAYDEKVTVTPFQPLFSMMLRLASVVSFGFGVPMV